jgi:hypothetical protein
LLVTSTFTKSLLRHTCHLFGGLPTFGFLPQEIGNRSIRSGAAMSLFLMHHPKEWIMILGRWASDAFLVYIRPQVLEWTNNMSKDMIKLDSFLDVGRSKSAPPIATDSDKRPPTLEWPYVSNTHPQVSLASLTKIRLRAIQDSGGDPSESSDFIPNFDF